MVLCSLISAIAASSLPHKYCHTALSPVTPTPSTPAEAAAVELARSSPGRPSKSRSVLQRGQHGTRARSNHSSMHCTRPSTETGGQRREKRFGGRGKSEAGCANLAPIFCAGSVGTALHVLDWQLQSKQHAGKCGWRPVCIRAPPLGLVSFHVHVFSRHLKKGQFGSSHTREGSVGYAGTAVEDVAMLM